MFNYISHILTYCQLLKCSIKFKKTYSSSEISGSDILKSESIILTQQRPAKSHTVREKTARA
jgi:hypothetical protein